MLRKTLLLPSQSSWWRMTPSKTDALVTLRRHHYGGYGGGYHAGYTHYGPVTGLQHYSTGGGYHAGYGGYHYGGAAYGGYGGYSAGYVRRW